MGPQVIFQRVHVFFNMGLRFRWARLPLEFVFGPSVVAFAPGENTWVSDLFLAGAQPGRTTSGWEPSRKPHRGQFFVSVIPFLIP